LKLKSFAKINLFLEVIGKYENNFHIINSIVSRINLYDEILIKKNKELIVSFKGQFGPLVENNNINLLFETLIKEKLIDDSGFIIEIDKNIPVGAGLGGGSSNVATILNFLEDNDYIKKEGKLLISRKIGSDIEFFLEENSALLSGKGEVESRFTIPTNAFVLLIYPQRMLSTKDVYSQSQIIDKKSIFKINESNQLLFDEIMSNTSNSLEESAMNICKEIREIKNILISDKECQYARMSGSGSCYFGIYKSEKDAKNAEKDLLNQHSDWWTCVTKLI
jgi:4-diphosphocytidyl-2-C-methyl-D-erythritol kinase